jgi:hemerythrin-like metal-binding protein
MSLSTLKNAVNTGVKGLDREHNRLVGVMQEIAANFERQGTAERVSGWFGELYVDVIAHFALEEAFMRDRRYEDYKAHKDDHERLLEELRLMMESFEEGMCDGCGMDLRDCLEAWFVGHVTQMDARLRLLVQ